MFDRSHRDSVEGEALSRLIAEVDREYFARTAFEEFASDYRQENSVRVVTVEVLDGLAMEAQLAVVADLFRFNQSLILSRPPEQVFAASDSPMTYIVDLVCEVVWQSLSRDPIVQLEDEQRESLAKF